MGITIKYAKSQRKIYIYIYIYRVPAPAPTYKYEILKDTKANTCPQEEVNTEVECKKAFAIVTKGKTVSPHSYTGSYSHTPPACVINARGDISYHFNRLATGTNNGNYYKICKIST